MHISPVFIDGVQFDECHVLKVGKQYVVYHRNIHKGTGGEYFYGMYNGNYCGQHEFIKCRVYTNALAGTLKRTDIVKPVIQIDSEYIFRKSSI